MVLEFLLTIIISKQSTKLHGKKAINLYNYYIIDSYLIVTVDLIVGDCQVKQNLSG